MILAWDWDYYPCVWVSGSFVNSCVFIAKTSSSPLHSAMWLSPWTWHSWPANSTATWVGSGIRLGWCAHVLAVNITGAFNRVSHTGVLYKAKKMTSAENMLTWLRDYLRRRSLSVMVNGQVSVPFKVGVRVLQGRILGPAFFDLCQQCWGLPISQSKDECLCRRHHNAYAYPLHGNYSRFHWGHVR